MSRRVTALVVACFVAAALALYLPALSLELMGDDYQWVQHAHHALYSPALLLADLDTFYRPASTWLLALDHLLWGFQPAGYHLTNVILHALAAAGLALVARRLGLSLFPSVAVGALWLATPLTSEPAIAVAIRFEDLLLLSWLVLIGAWPRAREEWTHGRRAIVLAATLLAVASKETWVVTALIVLAMELGPRRATLPTAIRSAIPFAVAAVLFAGVYFLAFPSDKGYFELSAAAFAKLPHMLAAFLYLTPLAPLQFPFSWREAAAAAAVVVAIAVAVRRRSSAGIVGATLLLAPLLPTLLVPYLPTRYTAIPYAGFLLLAVAAAADAVLAAAGPVRRIGAIAVAALAALALAAGAIGVRLELLDAARVSQAHARLLAEAAQIAPELPPRLPVAVVRAERDNPLGEIAAAPRGLFKLYYPRPPDPYGLIDAAALFEWVIGRDGVRVVRHDDGGTRFAGARGAVLLHEAGRFSWVDRGAPDVASEAARWLARGMPVRWVQRLPTP
jgi:hypothetical protein